MNTEEYIAVHAYARLYNKICASKRNGVIDFSTRSPAWRARFKAELQRFERLQNRAEVEIMVAPVIDNLYELLDERP